MAHERKESLPVSMLADRFGVGCPFTAMIFTNLAHCEVGGGEGRAHCGPRWHLPGETAINPTIPPSCHGYLPPWPNDVYGTVTVASEFARSCWPKTSCIERIERENVDEPSAA